MQIVTRSEARALGLKRFFSGQACPRGHVAERLVSNGTCMPCQNEKAAEKTAARGPLPLQPRGQAKADGERYFSTGKECAKGHMSERRSSDGKCRECARIKTQNRRVVDPDYAKASIQKWKMNNPEAKRVYTSRRRKLQRASAEHYTLNDVRDLLKLQNRKCACCLVKLSGENYHVDHVMPLFLGGDNSKSNIQILCPTCNLKKGAKHPDKWAMENGRLI